MGHQIRIFKNDDTSSDAKKTDFQTPPSIARYMADQLDAGRIRHVLEPTPGVGNIVNALRERGFQVTAPENYFTLRECWFDAVVMNPPFSEKFVWYDGMDISIPSGMRAGYYFLTDCMKRTDEVVALMPWFTISDSDARLKQLQEYGLISVTPLPRKTFEYARIQTVVLHLRRGFTGETIFKKIKPIL